MKFRLSLISFIVIYLSIAFFTMEDYGLSWDEPVRWASGDKKLDYYERLFSSEDPFKVMGSATNDVYPGLYDIPLAWARSNLDFDPILLSRVWNVLWGGLLLLSSVMLCRVCVRLSNRSSNQNSTRLLDDLLPIGAGLVLFLMPEVNGHLLINPKDVPFAATHGWALVSLVCVVRDFPNTSKRRFVVFGFAVGLSMAMRPPGIVVLCYYGFFAMAWVLLVARKSDFVERFSMLGRFVFWGGVSAVVSIVAMVPFWPKAHRNPFGPITASVDGVSRLKDFSSSQPVLYAGEFFEAGSTPWAYPVWMFIIKQPEWVSLLLMIGLFFVVRKWKDNLRELLSGEHFRWSVAILVFSILFPIGYVIVTHSAIHNGFRHMFYVLPSVSVVTVLAVRKLLSTTGVVQRWRFGVLGILAVCLILTTTSIVRLFPYQYIYYNSFVGGVAGAYGKYESDYWFLVGKEGAGLIIENETNYGGTKPIGVFVLGPVAVVEPYLANNMEVVKDINLATYYLGRPMAVLDGVGEVVGGVNRMGVPLLVVVKLNSGHSK